MVAASSLAAGLAVGLLAGLATAPSVDVVSAVNAAATVVLVLVTGGYVALTYRLVGETRDARRQEVMPVINVEPEPYAIGAYGAKVENVGNGPAKDVDATISLEPGGPEHELRSKNIAAGGFTGSLEPEMKRDVAEDYERLEIDGCLTDVWGVRDDFHDVFDLGLLAEDDGADSIMEDDQVSRRLRNIERSLESIADGVEMDGLEKNLTIRNRRRILDHITGSGGITLEELCRDTGLTGPEAGEIVMWLKEAGSVDYPGDPGDIITEHGGDVEICPIDS